MGAKEKILTLWWGGTVKRWFIFCLVCIVTFVLGVHINLQLITQIIQEAFQREFHVNVEDVGIYYHTGLKAAIVKIQLLQPIDDATALSVLLDDLKPQIEKQGIDEGEVVGWSIKIGSEEQVYGKSVWEIELAEEFLKSEERRVLYGSVSHPFAKIITTSQKPATPQSYPKQHRIQPLIWPTSQQIETIIKEMRKIATNQKPKQPLTLPYKIYSTTPNDITRERGTPVSVYVDKGCLYYLYITSNSQKGEIFVFKNQKLVLVSEIVFPLTDVYLGRLVYIHATNWVYQYGLPQMCVATTISGKVEDMVPAEVAYKTQKHMVAGFVIGWFDKTLKGILLSGGRTPVRFFIIVYGDIEWFLRNFITFWKNLENLVRLLL